VEFDERWVSLILLVIVQCFLGDLLWNTDGVLLRPIIACLKRHPTMLANALNNMADGCKKMGMPCTAEVWVMFNVGCGIHHVCGSTLALLGYLLGNVWLFRVGISFEIGEDVLHYGEMAYALVRPPGPKPFKLWPKATWAMLALHHSLGLTAGTFAYLNLADWPEVQWLVFLLLGGVVPGILGAPLQLFGDLTERSTVGKLNAVVAVGGFAFLLYARFVVYFPLALSLHARVAEEYGAQVGHFVAVPLVLFGIFNCVSLVVNLPAMINCIRLQISTKERLRAFRRFGATSALHLPTPLHFDAGPDKHDSDGGTKPPPAPADTADSSPVRQPPVDNGEIGAAAV